MTRAPSFSASRIACSISLLIAFFSNGRKYCDGNDTPYKCQKNCPSGHPSVDRRMSIALLSILQKKIVNKIPNTETKISNIWEDPKP